MSKSLSPFYLGAVLIALAGAAFAGVFARINSPEEAVKMWKLHEPKGGALILGKIESREAFQTTLPDHGDVEMTKLTIAVFDSVTSRKDLGHSITAFYLGGVQYQTSAQPSDFSTKPGATAALFLRPNPDSRFPGFWIDGMNAVVSAAQSASGETILLGQGEGSVNPVNRKAADFFAIHRTALSKVPAGK